MLDQAITQVANARGQVGALDNRLSDHEVGSSRYFQSHSDGAVDRTKISTLLKRSPISRASRRRYKRLLAAPMRFFDNSLLNFLKSHESRVKFRLRTYRNARRYVDTKREP